MSTTLHTTLPVNLTQWTPYFRKTYQYIEDVLPTITYGVNKYHAICRELVKFRRKLFARESTDLNLRDVSLLFQFTKSCAGLISLVMKYQPRTWLEELKYSGLSGQYNEMASLWGTFNSISSSLFINSFEEINVLAFAHHKDLISLKNTISEKIKSSNPKISSFLMKFVDQINLIVSIPNCNDIICKLVLNHSQFRIIESIGKGACAVVYKASMIDTGDIVAVKELNTVQLTKRRVLSLKRELNSYVQLSHPNLLKFVGVTVTPPFCLVTQYLPSGSLYDFLAKSPEKLSMTQRMKIAIGISRGIEYLDVMRTLHRDIKSQNVLLTEKHEAVICDFGLTRVISSQMTAEIGTIQYMAPELIGKIGGVYNTSVDVYAFGIVLWELLFGKLPYYGMLFCQIAVLVMNNKLRPEIPTGNNGKIGELMGHCWNHDPKKRPKISYLREKLESCEYVYEGTDINELKDWIAQTRDAHTEILQEAIRQSEESESQFLAKVRDLNPLDPIAIPLLTQILNNDLPIYVEFFESIFKLVTQTISLEVQSIAGCILKLLLLRDSLFSIINSDEIMKRIILIEKSSPTLALEAVKCVADRLENPIMIITDISMLPQSHIMIDILESVIQANYMRINPEDLMFLFDVLYEHFSISVFGYLLSLYGTKPVFFTLACSSLLHLSIFIKEMSKSLLSDNNNEITSIFEIQIEENELSLLQQNLENISNALITPLSSRDSISYEEARYIIDKIIPHCGDPVLIILYSLCSEVERLRPELSKYDIWTTIIRALDNGGQESDYALRLIIQIPPCDYQDLVHKLWSLLVKEYSKVQNTMSSKAISIMFEQDIDLDFTELSKIINRSFEESIELSVNLCLSMKAHQFIKLTSYGFWDVIVGILIKKDSKQCSLLGIFISKLMENDEPIPISPDFVAASLNFIYEQSIDFSTSLIFIKIITNLCKDTKYLAFVAKRNIYQYLQQLPWRYPNEPLIKDVLVGFLSVVQ